MIQFYVLVSDNTHKQSLVSLPKFFYKIYLRKQQVYFLGSLSQLHLALQRKLKVVEKLNSNKNKHLMVFLKISRSNLKFAAKKTP